MLATALATVFWMISNSIWIVLFLGERKRRRRAEHVANHFFTLCQMMNDGSTFFVDLGTRPELRQ